MSTALLERERPPSGPPPTPPAAPAPAPAARAGLPGSTRASAIYEGTVYHRRWAPIEHGFTYKIFLPLFDLDELPELLDGVPLWSARGRAPARFRRSDYLGDPAVPLAQSARDLVEEKLGSVPSGPVRLLANPRYWGVGFNPVAFYFLHGDGSDQPVEAVIASVTNTPWGERRHYVLEAAAASGEEPGHPEDPPEEFGGSFEKRLHVSPFMPMGQTYRWRANEPGDELRIQIANYEDGGRVFHAGLDLRRREIDPQLMRRLLFSYPPMTLATIARIYVNALKLKLKGAPYFANRDPGEESG